MATKAARPKARPRAKSKAGRTPRKKTAPKAKRKNPIAPKKKGVRTGRRGPPSSLTPALQKRICSGISDGLTFEDACRIVHIASVTFRVWRERGTEDERKGVKSIFTDLLEAVRNAESGFKRTHLRRIKQASLHKGPGVWQAAAWLLERKFPAEFAVRQHVAITNKLDDFVKAFDALV